MKKAQMAKKLVPRTAQSYEHRIKKVAARNWSSQFKMKTNYLGNKFVQTPSVKFGTVVVGSLPFLLKANLYAGPNLSAKRAAVFKDS